RLSESSRRKARRASGTTCSSRKGSCGLSSSGSATGSGGGRGSILALGSTSRDVADGRIALVGRTAETGGEEAFPRDAGSPDSARSTHSSKLQQTVAKGGKRSFTFPSVIWPNSRQPASPAAPAPRRFAATPARAQNPGRRSGRVRDAGRGGQGVSNLSRCRAGDVRAADQISS